MAERSGTHRWLAGVAAALAVMALAAGEPYPADLAPALRPEASYVTAIDVARWIRDRRPGLRLIDVRPDTQFAMFSVHGAENIPAADLPRREWSRDAFVVVYGATDAQAARATHALRAMGVASAHALRGGVLAWIEQIAEPRLASLPATATDADRAAQREQVELSRYFGGTPIVPPAADRERTTRPTQPAGRSPVEAAAVARIIRRGC